MAEPTVAALLLESARHDVVACRVLAAAAEVADTVTGFHAQQACEKCLKAVLSAAGIEFRRTHDLVTLIDLLARAGIAPPQDLQWVDELNPYAVEARYGLIQPGRLDRARALAAAERMLAWATLEAARPRGQP
jgi:HEPN domain-containing protein